MMARRRLGETLITAGNDAVMAAHPLDALVHVRSWLTTLVATRHAEALRKLVDEVVDNAVNALGVSVMVKVPLFGSPIAETTRSPMAAGTTGPESTTVEDACAVAGVPKVPTSPVHSETLALNAIVVLAAAVTVTTLPVPLHPAPTHISQTATAFWTRAIFVHTAPHPVMLAMVAVDAKASLDKIRVAPAPGAALRVIGVFSKNDPEANTVSRTNETVTTTPRLRDWSHREC